MPLDFTEKYTQMLSVIITTKHKSIDEAKKDDFDKQGSYSSYSSNKIRKT